MNHSAAFLIIYVIRELAKANLITFDLEHKVVGGPKTKWLFAAGGQNA